MMEPFFISLSGVFLAELGDKTQLLAIFLAARFKKPIPIIIGILLATLANHFLATLVGVAVRSLLTPEITRWVLAFAFFAAAIWALIPDKLAESETQVKSYSVFLATFIAFFLAEMGDKTQVVTATMAAQFDSIFYVMLGSSVGMLLANVPAVFLGQKLTRLISMTLMRYLAASAFLLLALSVAVGFYTANQ